MSLVEIAQQTLAIVGRGEYAGPGGKVVKIGELIDAALRGTVLYRPEQLDILLAERAGPSDVQRSLPSDVRRSLPRIEVTTETTAQASRRLAQDEGIPFVVALNFASAKNPGGGFLRGARAQEEDLARCSALYTCQLTQPDYYAANREHGSVLYTDHMIYSPDVPFFRDDQLKLLDHPFCVSIITAPAPNAGEAQQRGPAEARGVRATLEARTRKVLAVAAAHGHRTLVLGAWGCGVFRNDPRDVAAIFADALADSRFAGAFDRVVFAIWERGPARPNLRAFEERLGVRAAL